mgnify:CR=1 FL=1
MTEKNWDEPLDFKKEEISVDYKLAGVDIDAGNEFVNQIKTHVKSTHRPEVMGGFGGFNGMMRIPAGYESPILVSGTDGVGTKGKLASLYNRSFDIGIDLVAMCVNDIITCGAEPLYFLDYISTSKVKDNQKLFNIVGGIAKGCSQAGCALLGGETAEHPQDLATKPDYDLAGFCTGVVEESKIIDGKLINPGDKIIGIESNGVHANGFSLIRYLTFRHQIKVSDYPELLDPTTIYASLVKDLIKDLPILGMAHITGGGLPENLPRCLPRSGLGIKIDYSSWKRPDIFKVIQDKGNVSEEEMRRVFNLGIGYCVIVPPKVEVDTQLRITGHGYKSWTIGEVVLE